jgi:1,4-dihydroxy-2-naphthoyl-CoA hydrolase
MFRNKPSLAYLNELGKHSLSGHLGIEFTGFTEDSISAKMPVDDRTKQPYGILHGGASVALAETMGSIAATLTLDTDKEIAVGLDINANHIRSVQGGFVYALAKPLHIGRSTQVWEIKINDEQERLVCVSRLTLTILPRK